MNRDKPLPIFLIAGTAIATVMVASGLLIFFKNNGGVQSALLALFLVPSMVMSFKNPRWGLLALLIYLPFANTIAFSMIKVFKVVGNMIKYNNAYPLYKLAKDAFYFPALLGILVSTGTWGQLRPKIKPLLIAIVVLLVSCLLTLIFVNFADGGIGGFVKGFVGSKILLGYIPLILCGYYLVRQQKDVFFISRLLVILVLISCSLCFIQYFLLTQGICPDNAYISKLPPVVPPSALRFYPDISDKATLKAVCFVGGSLLYNPAKDLIRLPGTFSDPWQWAWFLISASFITYAASFSDPSPRWRVTGWVAMALVLLTTLISGQRVALLVVPIAFLVLLLLTAKKTKWLFIRFTFIAGLTCIAVSQIGFLQDKINDFFARWEYSPPFEFIVNQFKWLLWIQGESPNIFGLGGLGGATSATRRLTTESTRLIETFYVKLLYEIGLVGFLGFMAVMTVLTILTFRAYRSLKSPALRHWGLCLWVFVLFISYNPWYYPLTVEPVGVYYWLFAGILLRLPELKDQLDVENGVIDSVIDEDSSQIYN